MTSGAMKQGVPQKVLRARYFCAAQAFWKCPLPLPPQLPLALLGLSAHPHAQVHSLVQRHMHLAPTGGCQAFLRRPGTLEVPAAAAASVRGAAGALCKQQRALPLYAYTPGVVRADVILFPAAPFTRAANAPQCSYPCFTNRLFGLSPSLSFCADHYTHAHTGLLVIAG